MNDPCHSVLTHLNILRFLCHCSKEYYNITIVFFKSNLRICHICAEKNYDSFHRFCLTVNNMKPCQTYIKFYEICINFFTVYHATLVILREF